MDFKYSATAKLEEGMRVRVQAGDHEYIVDEPVEAGGTDQGAMPGMVLLASLAGCKGMVTRLYCSKYNIPLHSCEIVLTATGNLNQSTGEIHQLFEIEMNVDADLDADGLAKLEKFVEDQCAIGTLLKQENEVKTTFNLISKS